MGSPQRKRIIFTFLRSEWRYCPISLPHFGVLAQLVERLNGIEEVRGSNPLGSISLVINDLRCATCPKDNTLANVFDKI